MGRPEKDSSYSRRDFLRAASAIGAVSLSSLFVYSRWGKIKDAFRTSPEKLSFIAKVDSYNDDLKSIVLNGFKELGITSEEIKGKKILLKPNLVETSEKSIHINTHPLIIRGAVEAFLHSGADSVTVAEGPGHSRDTFLILEESGMADVLYEDKVPFVNLNNTEAFVIPNRSGLSRLSAYTFPELLKQVDWIVSVAKMKTHHWAGATLSMKNMFGVMPGLYYGWPKNVLHWAGIDPCIVDINSILKPDLAIVDGIVGMEGDGPIMGTPKKAGVVVMGRNPLSVDATCARIMGIDPHKVPYLSLASKSLGSIDENNIFQRGELIKTVNSRFKLLDHIPVHRKIMGI